MPKPSLEVDYRPLSDASAEEDMSLTLATDGDANLNPSAISHPHASAPLLDNTSPDMPRSPNTAELTDPTDDPDHTSPHSHAHKRARSSSLAEPDFALDDVTPWLDTADPPKKRLKEEIIPTASTPTPPLSPSSPTPSFIPAISTKQPGEHVASQTLAALMKAGTTLIYCYTEPHRRLAPKSGNSVSDMLKLTLAGVYPTISF